MAKEKVFDERALVRLAKSSILDLEMLATDEDKREPIWNVLAARGILPSDRSEVQSTGRAVFKLSAIGRTYLEAVGLARLGDMWNATAFAPYEHTVMRDETATAYITAWQDECARAKAHQDRQKDTSHVEL